jgi:FkbM family methyltransferase
MKTLLDIGCNTLGGYDHLQQYEDITGSEIRKIFVEPNPECWLKIHKRLTKISNAILIKKAVSRTTGIIELLTRADIQEDIAATIKGKDYLVGSLSKCNMFVDDFNSYQIESTTIKDIIDEYNIIPEETILKIDAEGAEYDILDEIVRNNFIFKKIYCEFHIYNDNDNLMKRSLSDQLAEKNITLIDWQ